jgi:hypothetical protein
MNKSDTKLLEQAEAICREVALDLQEMPDQGISDPKHQAKKLVKAADDIHEVLVHGRGTGRN